MNEFERLAEMVGKLKNTSSSLEKKAVLGLYPDLQQILQYTYDTTKQYNITSGSIRKALKEYVSSGFFIKRYATIYELLDALAARDITGYVAIDTVCAFIAAHHLHEELILNVIDRDLKCKVAVSVINTVWPGLINTFDVALASSYWDHENKVDFSRDTYYCSRKIDGARNITIIDAAGNIKCMSRTGKEFTTLDVIQREIKRLLPQARNLVLDGEICMVDENGDDHFDQIVGLLSRKMFTIPNATYRVFDTLTTEEFFSGTSKRLYSGRLKQLKSFTFNDRSSMIRTLQQIPIENKAHLDMLFEAAQERNWEGLILRKDAPYKGKRSTDLLKVKAFSDSEYKVERIITGPFQVTIDGKEVIEETLASVKILHKGNEVGVGSGFSLAQRRYYYQHPEKLIGKTIKVKYFQESVDTSSGLPSLRFPVVTYIYDDGRFD